MSVKTLVASVVLVTSAACASKPVAGAGDETLRTVNRDRTLITQAEIDANPSLKAATALDMVKSLRPQFFTDRGQNTIQSGAAAADPEAGLVHASVNNGRIISIGELAEVHANEVLEVRFLNSGQAMQRFGTAARAGPIILVTTAKQ